MGECMILQEKNYIAQQRKKYLIYSVIWTLVVFTLFITGLLLTKTRANLLTVSACIMAIVAALYITRWISFSRYKDGDCKSAELLEEMSGDYHVYHSAIIPLTKDVARFEHVIVTGNIIYFVAYTKEQVVNHREEIQELLASRGIAMQHLCFLVAQDVNQMKQHANRIEKDMEKNHPKGTTSEQLDVYSKKISEILM